MPIDYGKASAAGRTLEDPCNGAYDLGIGCGGSDGNAWWTAGMTWSAFTAGLDAQALKTAPIETWPPSVTLLAPPALEARKTFVEDAKPWIVGEGTIKSWGAAQQDLRNYAEALANFLEEKGVKVPTKGPADLPPQAGMFGGLVKVVGLGIAGYLAIQFIKAAKD